MQNKSKVSFGSVRISEDVISSIAEGAITDISGVRIANAKESDLFSMKVLKPVKLSYKDNGLVLDINVIVKYGYSVPKTAAQVQDSVAEAIEGVTGLKVEAVNVHCVGISFSIDDSRNIKQV